MSAPLPKNFHPVPCGVYPALLEELKQEQCSICLDNFNMTEDKLIVCHYMKDGKPICPSHFLCLMRWVCSSEESNICSLDRARITSINGISIPQSLTERKEILTQTEKKEEARLRAKISEKANRNLLIAYCVSSATIYTALFTLTVLNAHSRNLSYLDSAKEVDHRISSVFKNLWYTVRN